MNTFHTPLDDAARRAYWTEQMELGYVLVQKVLAFPVQECGEGFDSLPEAAVAAGVEMQFSTSKIAGGIERVFFLRKTLVERVVDIGRAMNDRGWVLKIEDGYRSLEMQRQLVRKPELFDAILAKCIWEYGGQLPPIELVFRRAMVLIANLPKFGTHMSGTAIDISVFHRDGGHDGHREVWRGNPYLEMSERTPMRSPFVEADAIANRLEITAVLEAHDFVHYPFEFWHYNQGDAKAHFLTGQTAAARYGAVDWNPQTNQVTSCANPLVPLNSPTVIEGEIAAAMARAKAK